MTTKTIQGIDWRAIRGNSGTIFTAELPEAQHSALAPFYAQARAAGWMVQESRDLDIVTPGEVYAWLFAPDAALDLADAESATAAL